MRLESSFRGRVVRNGERWEAISAQSDARLELGFFPRAAFSKETIAAVKMDNAWISFEPNDVESKMALLEARVEWLEMEISSTRITLNDEKDRRLAAEKAIQEHLDGVNDDSSSGSDDEMAESADIFPRHSESKIRDYSHASGEALLEKGAAYREWTRLGYDAVLVAAMFGHNDKLEWLAASGYSLLSLGAAGESCLYLASEFGHLDTVKWIVDHINAKSASRTSESAEQASGGSTKNSEKNHGNLEKNRKKANLVSPRSAITPSASVKIRPNGGPSIASQFNALKTLRHKENGLSCVGVAVANGHLLLAAWFLNQGWNERETMETIAGYSNGDTLLHIAARHGQKEAICAIARFCPALISIHNHSGESPLHTAAKHSQIDSISSLLEAGVLSEVRDDLNLSPFLTAVNAGHLPIAKILLESAEDKADVASRHRDGDGSTAFIIACFRGHLELAAYLLDNGSKIDEVNASGNNALAVAAFRGDEKVVKFLLSRFGRPEGWNFAIPNGKISGKLKNSNESLEDRKEGIEHRRDLSNGSPKPPSVSSFIPDGSTLRQSNSSPHPIDSLHDSHGSHASSSPSFARAPSNPVIAQQLVHFKNLVNAVNEAGNTPMLLAAYGGHVGTLEALHKFGVPISQSNHLGCTPLLIVCFYGHEESAFWCVRQGANVHDKDRIGISPFIAAAMSGSLPILEFLLDHGANLNDMTWEGYSALHMAAYCGRASTVRRLLALGLSPVSVASNGTTALMIAALNGQLETLQVLISYGMTVNDRLRAAKLAESKGFDDIGDYLRTRAYSREVSTSPAP